MQNLIKEINQIMGKEFIGSQLTIKFLNDGGIVFGIYEQEIPIIVNSKTNEVYLDCELTSDALTADMLDELAQIVKLIEQNIDIVLECIK